MNPQRCLSKCEEQLICNTAGYELTASAWLPNKNKIIFVTTPVRKYRITSHQTRSKRSIIVGFLNLATYALGSLITEPCSISRVSKIAAWKDGILMCSPSGLVFLNLTTGVYKILVSSKELNDNYVHDAAVNIDKSVWFTCISKDQAGSRVYRYDNSKDRKLSEIQSGLLCPTCIALSPNGKRCYIGSSAEEHIYSFQISPDGALHSCTRLNYISVQGFSTLFVDTDGSLYVSVDSMLICFDRDGTFIDRAQTIAPIISFILTENSLFILHDKSWYIIKNAYKRRTSVTSHIPRL